MLHLLARPLLEMAHVPLPLVLERALTPALVIGAMAYFCSSTRVRILTQRRVWPVAGRPTIVGQQAPAYLLTPARCWAVRIGW